MLKEPHYLIVLILKTLPDRGIKLSLELIWTDIGILVTIRLLGVCLGQIKLSKVGLEVASSPWRLLLPPLQSVSDAVDRRTWQIYKHLSVGLRWLTAGTHFCSYLKDIYIKINLKDSFISMGFRV